ncbi:MAG TPA: alpha-L-arabinofuranosidase C-terminal domain-containing protein, partial [Sphingobacterium sp.]|nr:alpha-L-arabinofuranosidase C-terminal domain-containing protein [Sphingobacterium sp.]
LLQDNAGNWHCLWTLNDEDGIISYTTSTDLTYWKPQSYPYVFEGRGNCRMIEAGYDPKNKNYVITWINTKGVEHKVFGTTTKDFKHYETAQKQPKSARINQRTNAHINGQQYTGSVHKVAWKVIDHLIRTQQFKQHKNELFSEKMADDPIRFAGLETIEAHFEVQPNQSKKISDMLIGAFFEDINYAADGGLYAELIRNRDFEFSNRDRKEWNAKTAWATRGEGIAFEIETSSPIHENNKHYAALDVKQVGTGLVNEGYDGIPIKKGEAYDFSIFARSLDGKGKKVKLRLVGNNGKIYGEATTNNISNTWKKISGTIIATETVALAQLEVIPQSTGKIALDMISLFPRNTFKGRKNGLRADLAQILADMKPRFIRFPGGCVAHGNGIHNIYNWKNTIGPLEARKQDRNLWGYHQSMGLGYFEYFRFCADLHAEPLPVLAAGVPCQNSSDGGHGQQCGIPMHDMDDYIQDILDLIEWANGDPKKNKWAKMRADAGHPEPFHLKYIGIGNEDLISDIFEERFAMIVKAIQEKYPEIIIVGTSGPFYEGSDYTEGWRVATETGIQMVDEHYYVPPGWFIHNQDYYDRYDRNKPQVYLGEYAAHGQGRKSTIETALTEALHLANIERNGDIVALTSYAPLLAREHNTQWNPDLIYFNNTEIKPTVGYYVQQLFGNHAGDEYLTSTVTLSGQKEAVQKRVHSSIVRNSKTNEIYIKLLNLLPVEVKTSGNIAELAKGKTQAVQTTLTGKPDDATARPVEKNISLDEIEHIVLSPYSLTVIKIHGH